MNRDCEWCPTSNMIAYWQPEQNNKPARVTIAELPTLKEIRQKNLVYVEKCMLYWQSQGKYLAVKIDRVVKGKKTG
jgi:translation initiation factor 3 subunit B